MDKHFFEFLLRMGDTTLILSQRLGEWTGHGPILEEDLALTNTALDLLGQARMWLTLAGEVEGAGRDEDALAYLRDAHQFHNALLVERANGNYADTMARQFLFDVWHYFLLQKLERSADERVAAIAAKALKEVTYHVRRSSDMVVRLGDGTAESHAKMQAAIDDAWRFTGELFFDDAVDQDLAARGIGCLLSELREPWARHVAEVLGEATLSVPDAAAASHPAHRGGARPAQRGTGLRAGRDAIPAARLSGSQVVNAMAPVSAGQVFDWLQEVPDPEIPVLSVVDLGVVRDVRWDGETCVVVITPTYSGCPAMREITQDIAATLARHGVDDARVETRLAPAWTTDWMSEKGRAAQGLRHRRARRARRRHLRHQPPRRARHRVPALRLARHAWSAISAPRRARRCTAASPAASLSIISRPTEWLRQ